MSEGGCYLRMAQGSKESTDQGLEVQYGNSGQGPTDGGHGHENARLLGWERLDGFHEEILD